MLKFKSLSLVIFCALLLVSSNLEAKKPLCLFNLHATEYGDTSFENEDFVDWEQNEIHKWDLSANVAPRIKMSDNFTFLPRFDFQREHFRYTLDDDILAKHLPRHFRTIFGGFATLVDINENWGFETYTALGIESDYNNTSTEDMKIKASLMINYNIEENTQISFGAAYDTYLGGEDVIPQIGFWWMPNDKFYVNTVLPRFLDLAWIPEQRFHLGVEGKLRGSYYRLSDDPNKSFVESGRVEERFAQTGLFAEFRIVKHLFVRASGGAKYLHEYKFLDENGGDIILDTEPDDTFYFEVGLSWTVNGPFDYLE